MSAICGIVSLNNASVPEKDLNAVVSALAHLGPDGSGAWAEGPCGLGHQQFWITPESLHESLPFHDPGSGLAITADARLDNRDELCAALDVSPAQGREMPDSLLIMRAYQKWGEDCVHHFLGDFAFALWDRKKGRMILVTDHMGVRPVHYYEDGARFLFATEIKGILAVPWVRTRLDMERLALQAAPVMMFLDKTRTFFEGIQRAPAASIITVRKGRVSRRSYWKPEIPEPVNFKSEDEFAEAFQDVFGRAVKARLRSAFPVASLLSGGLDSSAIAGMAATILKGQNKRLFTFSAVLPEGYQGSGRDEKEYIDLFRFFDNIDLLYITNKDRGPFDNLDRLVWGGEQPGYTSRHYQYTSFAEAAGDKGCRIILDGGGGEMGPTFHGDGVLAEWLIGGHWLTVARELGKRPGARGSVLWAIIKREVIKPIAPDFVLERRFRADIYRSLERSPIRQSFVEQYLGKDLRGRIRMADQAVRSRPAHRGNQVRDINLSMGRGGGNFYAGYERAAMLFPFYDLRVLNLCVAAPAYLKIRNGYKRNLVRIGMKGILPDKLRFRTSKEPFGPDYHDRYNRQRPVAVEYLSRIAADDPVRGIVDVEKLQRMAAYQMTNNRDDTPMDFAAMHSVPQGVYLIAFLKRFGAYWR